MGEKVGLTNCVFEKLCSSENTIFIVFSANTAIAKKEAVCWKNRKFLKNSGLFLNMAKRCFCLFFSGFNVIVVCFFVSGKVAQVLKMLVLFSQFWGFCLFGFRRFRCFCASCCCFLLSRFCFFVALFFLLLDCFWCCSCFVYVVLCFFLFFFLFFCYCFCSFFGGFKGQVRLPKGPPHLALNPPHFFAVSFFFFLEGLRVRSGSPKGHLTCALNPPILFCLFLCFVCFPFFASNRKKTCFPPEKGILVYFSGSPFVSLLPFFGLPLFHFLFLCLSLVLLFLPSFLFLMSISVSCFMFLSCLHFISRCSFVFVFLLVVLFVFNHSIVYVSFASCFVVVVFWAFVALVFVIFWILATYQQTSLK